MTVHMKRSKDNFQESILFFHQVNPRDQTQIVGLEALPPERAISLAQELMFYTSMNEL